LICFIAKMTMNDREKRRRMVRICALFMNPLIVYFLARISAGVVFLKQEFHFDANGTLDLEVSGCNVDVFAMTGQETRGRLTLERNLVRSKATTRFRMETRLLEFIKVRNEVLCERFQSRFCEPVCSIGIFVPDKNTLDLRLMQEAVDNGGLVAFQSHPGVKLSRLTVSGTSVYTRIVENVISEQTRVTSGSEQIDVINSFLGASEWGWLVAPQSNIRVIFEEGNAIVDEFVQVVEANVRSTTNDKRICTWAKTQWYENISVAVDECLTGRSLGRLQSTFDADLNRKITATDFDEGVQSLDKCCGSNCPVRDLCSWSYTPLFIPFGASFVWLEDFFENVRQNRDYTVIDRCTRRVLLAPADSFNLTNLDSTMKVQPLSLRTNQGTIQVALVNSSEIITESSNEGLRMLRASATPLMNEITNAFANGKNVDRSENFFAVFYVDFSPYFEDYAKVQTFKFVYTNQPVFLSVPPSLLSAVSFGLLSPETKIYRLDFAAPGCFSTNATVAEDIGKEIFRVLLPRFQSSLLGTLVEVQEGSTFSAPILRQFTRDVSTGEILTSIRKPHVLGRFSLISSVIIGCTVAALIISKFSMIMHVQLRKKFKSDEARAKVFISRNQNDEESAEERQNAMRKMEEMHHVLERPVELCDVLLVDPVRRHLADSLVSFVNQTYFVDTKMASLNRKKRTARARALAALFSILRCRFRRQFLSRVEPKEALEQLSRRDDIRMESSLTMSKFMREYESFCFERNLDMEENLYVVKKRLLTRFGVRARSFMATRVQGCRWKSSPTTLCSYDNDYRLYAKERESLKNLISKKGEVSLEELFGVFLNEFCEVSGDPLHFVSFDDLFSEKRNKMMPGFGRAFNDFVLTIRPETRKGQLLLTDEFFQQFGLRKKHVRVETIRALKEIALGKTGQHSQRFSARWYVVQYTETLIHQLSFAVGPAMILQVAFKVQFSHSATLGAELSLQPEDFLLMFMKNNAQDFIYADILSYSGIFASGSLGISYFLLFFVYLDAMKLHTVVERAVRISYRAILSASLFVLFTFITMQCVWVMLAAFLYPEKFLPFGASLGCFISIIGFQFKKIAQAKAKVETAVKDIFLAKISERVRDAINMRLCSNGAAQETRNPMEIGSCFEPSDLFSIIDADDSDDPANDTLSREEFDKLFDTLDINVLESKRDILFAYCDTAETDGQISREEFLDSWDWLMEQLGSNIVGRGLGLSDFEVSVYLFILSSVLSLVFTFLLVSVAAFHPNGGLQSVIQSALIASTTFASSTASDTFGAAAAATDLTNAEAVEKKVTEEVEGRIDPETLT